MRERLRAWLLIEAHERAGWLRFIVCLTGGSTARHLFGFDSSDPISWQETAAFFGGVAVTHVLWSALAYIVITAWAHLRKRNNEPESAIQR